MKNDRVFFVEDEHRQVFCMIIADASYEARFRKHAAQWMRLKHDPKGHSPVGKMKIAILTREEFAAR